MRRPRQPVPIVRLSVPVCHQLGTHRNGHQEVQGRKISSETCTASEDISLIKERVRFVAELLAAQVHGQARPSGGLQKNFVVSDCIRTELRTLLILA